MYFYSHNFDIKITESSFTLPVTIPFVKNLSLMKSLTNKFVILIYGVKSTVTVAKFPALPVSESIVETVASIIHWFSITFEVPYFPCFLKHSIIQVMNRAFNLGIETVFYNITKHLCEVKSRTLRAFFLARPGCFHKSNFR